MRDKETERDLARLREELGTEKPVITTPDDRRNGKRWAWETIGKAVAAVLVLLAVAIWGRAIAIYGLPPRVDAIEAKLSAPHEPMSQAEVDQLAAAIAAALPKKDKR